MSAIVYLAHEIEWLHAMERVRLKRQLGRAIGPRRSFRQLVAAEFDPHAATELAGLIEQRLSPRAPSPPPAHDAEHNPKVNDER